MTDTTKPTFSCGIFSWTGRASIKECTCKGFTHFASEPLGALWLGRFPCFKTCSSYYQGLDNVKPIKILNVQYLYYGYLSVLTRIQAFSTLLAPQTLGMPIIPKRLLPLSWNPTTVALWIACPIEITFSNQNQTTNAIGASILRIYLWCTYQSTEQCIPMLQVGEAHTYQSRRVSHTCDTSTS